MFYFPLQTLKFNMCPCLCEYLIHTKCFISGHYCFVDTVKYEQDMLFQLFQLLIKISSQDEVGWFAEKNQICRCSKTNMWTASFYVYYLQEGTVFNMPV